MDEQQNKVEIEDPIGKIISIQVTVYKDGTSTVMVKGARYNAHSLDYPTADETLSKVIRDLHELVSTHNAIEDLYRRQKVLGDTQYARLTLNIQQERQIAGYIGKAVLAKDTGQWIDIGEALQVLWQLGWDTPLDWHLDPIEETVWYSSDAETWNKHPDLIEHPFWGLNWRSAQGSK